MSDPLRETAELLDRLKKAEAEVENVYCIAAEFVAEVERLRAENDNSFKTIQALHQEIERLKNYPGYFRLYQRRSK